MRGRLLDWRRLLERRLKQNQYLRGGIYETRSVYLRQNIKKIIYDTPNCNIRFVLQLHLPIRFQYCYYYWISILLLQMCCFGNPNMVTQIVSKPRTTYIDTIKANSGLDSNTKEIRNAMLDQIVWKDLVGMARDDSRPKLVNKYKRCHTKKVKTKK